MSTTIADNPQRRRFEIRVDGDLAGFVTYRRQQDQIEFVHTEIDDRFEGQGLGSKLVALALDDARAHSLAVLPSCPFVKGYIQRHREYADLVPQDRRVEYGL
jgi:predicted GNAT family acetyltransferase